MQTLAPISIPDWAESLPDKASIWIFASEEAFGNSESDSIVSELKNFCARWNAHGQLLTAHASIAYDRFLIFAVDNTMHDASGCSIDSLNAFVRKLSAQLNKDLFSRTHLFYHHQDTIEVCPSSEIKSRIQTGDISPETIVFQNFVKNISELKNNWQVAAKDSYIKSMF